MTDINEILRQIKAEAYQREPVPLIGLKKEELRGLAFALSARLCAVERMCRDVLKSPSPQTTPSVQMMGLDPATIEACARLIEENIIMDTSAGKVLAPRQDGNRDGLHYAAAIRALADVNMSGPNSETLEKVCLNDPDNDPKNENIRSADPHSVAEDLLRRVLQLVQTRGDLQRFYDKITGLEAWDTSPSPQTRGTGSSLPQHSNGGEG